MENPKVSKTFRRIIALTGLVIAGLYVFHLVLGDHADVRASYIEMVCRARINWFSLALTNYIEDHQELDAETAKTFHIARMNSIAMQFHDKNPKLFHEKCQILFGDTKGRQFYDENSYCCSLAPRGTPSSGGYVWANDAFEQMLTRSRDGDAVPVSIIMCHDSSYLHHILGRAETVLLMSDGVVRRHTVEPKLYREWVDSKFRKGVTTLSEFDKVRTKDDLYLEKESKRIEKELSRRPKKPE